MQELHKRLLTSFTATQVTDEIITPYTAYGFVKHVATYSGRDIIVIASYDNGTTIDGMLSGFQRLS